MITKYAWRGIAIVFAVGVVGLVQTPPALGAGEERAYEAMVRTWVGQFAADNGKIYDEISENMRQELAYRRCAIDSPDIVFPRPIDITLAVERQLAPVPPPATLTDNDYIQTISGDFSGSFSGLKPFTSYTADMLDLPLGLGRLLGQATTEVSRNYPCTVTVDDPKYGARQVFWRYGNELVAGKTYELTSLIGKSNLELRMPEQFVLRGDTIFPSQGALLPFAEEISLINHRAPLWKTDTLRYCSDSSGCPKGADSEASCTHLPGPRPPEKLIPVKTDRLKFFELTGIRPYWQPRDYSNQLRQDQVIDLFKTNDNFSLVVRPLITFDGRGEREFDPEDFDENATGGPSGIRPDKINIEVAGSPLQVKSSSASAYGYNGFTLTPTAPVGKSVVSISLAGKYKRDIPVTTNQPLLSVATDARGTVTAGRIFKAVLAVKGEADMRPYKVNWTADGSGDAEEIYAVSIRKEGRFEVGSGSETEFQFVLREEAPVPYILSVLNNGGLISLGAAILKDERHAWSDLLSVKVRARVGKLALKAGTTGGRAIGSGPFDLFMSKGRVGEGPPGNQAGLFADIEVDGRSIEDLKLRDAEFLSVEQDPSRKLEMRGDTVAIAAGAVPGTARLRGVAKANQTMATPDDGTLYSAPIEFTINRPYLLLGQDGRARLIIEGPADMNRYSARWALESGGSLEAAFTRKGNFESEITLPPGEHFRFVEIVADGITHASLGPESLAFMAPVVTIEAPEFFVQGRIHKVKAVIDALPESFVQGAYCRWKMDPEFGSILFNNNRITRADGRLGCETSISFSEDPKTARRYPRLSVDINYDALSFAGVAQAR